MQHISLTDNLRRRRFDISGPSAADELNADQLTGVMRIKQRYDNEDLQAIRISALLFSIDKERMQRLTTLQKLQLAATVEFLFEPRCKMDKWLFNSLGSGLFGPADGLENLTFGELMHADRRLDQYRETGEERYLDELVAILMRKRKRFLFGRHADDVRSPFKEGLITKQGRKIAKRLTLPEKAAIHFNYVACRSRLADFFPNLFPEPDQDEPVNNPASNDNWLDVAIDLARKEHVLGNIHDIEKDNVYLVLRVLDRVIAENKKLIKEYER